MLAVTISHLIINIRNLRDGDNLGTMLAAFYHLVLFNRDSRCFRVDALANGLVNVRLLLKELPQFSGLPTDILYFLGLNTQSRLFPHSPASFGRIPRGASSTLLCEGKWRS